MPYVDPNRKPRLPYYIILWLFIVVKLTHFTIVLPSDNTISTSWHKDRKAQETCNKN